jgi:hypothetical protein
MDNFILDRTIAMKTTGQTPRKSSTNSAPLSSAKRTTSKKQPLRRRINYVNIVRNLGSDHHRQVLEKLRELRVKYPHCPKVNGWTRRYLDKIHTSERMVDDALLSDDVTTIAEGPFDLPPVPYNGSTVVERLCRVQKLANQGTIAGGLHALLQTGDLASFSDGVFRVKEVKSWTVPRYNSGASAAEFSAVSVPLQEGSSGTEVMPNWESNWTRVGSGFSGLVTQFPLGDLPLFPTGGNSTILSHFIGDGYTGGSATDFLSVVFDVVLECLI